MDVQFFFILPKNGKDVSPLSWRNFCQVMLLETKTSKTSYGNTFCLEKQNFYYVMQKGSLETSPSNIEAACFSKLSAWKTTKKNYTEKKENF